MINIRISIFDFHLWLDGFWNSIISWLQHEGSGNEWKEKYRQWKKGGGGGVEIKKESVGLGR